MSGIGQCFRSPFLPLSSNLKHMKQLKTTEFLRLCSNEQTEPVKRRSIHSVVSVRTKALNSPPVLESSPAAAGDLSVLLQTGAALLLVYWIANFVFPEFISKNVQSENPSETDGKRLEDER